MIGNKNVTCKPVIGNILGTQIISARYYVSPSKQTAQVDHFMSTIDNTMRGRRLEITKLLNGLTIYTYSLRWRAALDREVYSPQYLMYLFRI